jgi:hypothetical protein
MKTPRLAVWLMAAVPLIAAEPLIRIPPVRTTVEIGGQPVSIGASGELSAAEHPNVYTISLVLDLSDLQARLSEILRAELDRSEACGQRLHILEATLIPASPNAVLRAKMHFEQWACAKVMGKSVSKRLVAGDGSVEVDLKPTLEGAAGAGVVADVREIQADGSLGEMLRSGSLGAAVREKVRASVQKALDRATDYRATLPPSIQNVLKLRAMRFGDAGSGRLELGIAA